MLGCFLTACSCPWKTPFGPLSCQTIFLSQQPDCFQILSTFQCHLYWWGFLPLHSFQISTVGPSSLGFVLSMLQFYLLRTMTVSFLLITPTRSLPTHLIWHTYCALSQLDCRVSPYRLFLSWLLILTHYLWHLISDRLGLCARPISI